MTNEEYLKLELIKINIEIWESWCEDKLKEYLQEWKLLSIQRYKDNRIKGVMLTKRLGDYDITIITTINRICGIDHKFTNSLYTTIVIPEWISEEIIKNYA